MYIYPLDKYSYIFPDPRTHTTEQGVLAYGGDLSPTRLITAYKNGIFPWYKENDPILWWSPDPRLILKLDEFKTSKSLQKTINKKIFEIRFNTDFKSVIYNCSQINRDGQKGTWILPEVIDAYLTLHEMNIAHSFEAYFEQRLVGGGYGVIVGDVFCGESMFCFKNDASKVALYHLVQRLKDKGFSFIDCQIPTPHLISLGAKEISRDKFLDLIKIASMKYKEF